jgi:hypothetical protein
MSVVVIEVQDLKQWIQETVAEALRNHLIKELPPFLTRKQFMELLDIGESKTAELFNREDFPVNREFGNPRVPTHLLMRWVDEHTEWVSNHAGDGWKNRKKAM